MKRRPGTRSFAKDYADAHDDAVNRWARKSLEDSLYAIDSKPTWEKSAIMNQARVRTLSDLTSGSGHRKTDPSLAVCEGSNTTYARRNAAEA
jgi:hypothetical protein